MKDSSEENHSTTEKQGTQNTAAEADERVKAGPWFPSLIWLYAIFQ